MKTFIDVLLFFVLTWIELRDVVDYVAGMNKYPFEQTHYLRAERRFALEFFNENKDAFYVVEDVFHILVVEVLCFFPLSSVLFEHFFNVLRSLLFRAERLRISISDLLFVGLVNLLPTALE